MDIALSIGFPLRENLQYDCPLFDDVELSRHKKHEILKPLGRKTTNWIEMMIWKPLLL